MNDVAPRAPIHVPDRARARASVAPVASPAYASADTAAPVLSTVLCSVPPPPYQKSAQLMCTDGVARRAQRRRNRPQTRLRRLPITRHSSASRFRAIRYARTLRHGWSRAPTCRSSVLPLASVSRQVQTPTAARCNNDARPPLTTSTLREDRLTADAALSQAPRPCAIAPSRHARGEGRARNATTGTASGAQTARGGTRAATASASETGEGGTAKGGTAGASAAHTGTGGTGAATATSTVAASALETDTGTASALEMDTGARTGTGTGTGSVAGRRTCWTCVRSASASSPTTTTSTFPRCVGHAALTCSRVQRQVGPLPLVAQRRTRPDAVGPPLGRRAEVLPPLRAAVERRRPPAAVL